MIYGINFNGTEIPPAIQRMFARERKIFSCGCGETLNPPATYGQGNSCATCGKVIGTVRGMRALLKGVAQSPEERDAMLIQANNGHRKLFVVERKTAAAPWFGIYVF